MLMIFVAISISIVSVQAQDTGENPVSEAQSTMFMFTADDILSSNPETIQMLREAGYTMEDIEELKQYVLNPYSVEPSIFDRSLSRAPGTIDRFNVQCGAGAWANIILQVGAGPTILTHTFADGTTYAAGSHQCNSGLCLLSAGSQKNGVATSFFTAVHSSYAHRITSWCG